MAGFAIVSGIFAAEDIEERTRQLFAAAQELILPEAVRQELHDVTVVMADRIGATFLMVFTADGQLRLEVVPDEEEFGYDEIETELQIRALQEEKEELFTQLEAFYAAFMMGEE